MNCYEFKGGSGTASRLVPFDGTDYTVGAFVQANFGDREELALAGVPLGAALAADNPMAELISRRPAPGRSSRSWPPTRPLFPHQCKALARRVTPGWPGPARLARTSPATCSWPSRPPTPAPSRPATAHGHCDRLAFLPWERLDPFYEAVVQATEEAVVNALVANEDMTGRDGHRTPALPRRQVADLLARAGRLARLSV